MDYTHSLLLYQPITPLHIGCGQDVGVVDLPVIRERTTGYPFIPGSGIRGRLREIFGRNAADKSPEQKNLWSLFGPEPGDVEEESRRAGCVAVHDARILLFPVRSNAYPFLWITCPAVLRRFSRDVEAFLESPGPWKVDPGNPPGAENAMTANGEERLHLEEFEFTRQDLPTAVQTWLGSLSTAIGPADFSSKTALVADSTFHHFVTHATQVIQHNRLTSAKTVARGQLFSVEAVPPETVFYGFLGATDERRPADGSKEAKLDRTAALKKLKEKLVPNGAGGTLQLGGDEGTGLGVTRLAWASGG